MKKDRPRTTECITFRVLTGCGNLYLIAGSENNFLLETFIHLGKSGACFHVLLEAIARSISVGLKYGVPISEFVEQFGDLACSNTSWEDGVLHKSCMDAVAKALSRYCREYENYE